MPINIIRLNQPPSSHPNERIVFIKPLPRPPSLQADYEHANTFLNAIAAQCLPVMKAHHLSVTTLEEYEPNLEFIGRNFNNGEVIQLVLRRRDGSWLSLRQVQLVMMHELAHNLQMNHGSAFWVERNRFAGEMKRLWERGYTGEGFWGSGRSLDSLESHAGRTVTLGNGGDVEGLCGGTFRSSGRKRKRGALDGKSSLNWREQRDRRIEKRFGKNGLPLGEDEDARTRLEIGRRGPIGGRPRVAGSKRGRELRAAAALARFEADKGKKDSLKNEEGGSGSESATEDDGSVVDDLTTPMGEAAFDINGNRILDSKGLGMIKVCVDEDVDELRVKEEMEDFDTLQEIVFVQPQKPVHSTPQPNATAKSPEAPPNMPSTEASHASGTHQVQRGRIGSVSTSSHLASPPPLSTAQPNHRPPVALTPKDPTPDAKPAYFVHSTNTTSPSISPSSTIPCPICTTTNTNLNPTCTTCAHLLDRRKDPHAWKCGSKACRRSEYVNAGDCGRCGACGGRKEGVSL